MTRLLAKTVLAAVLGLSAFAVSVPAASAAPVEIRIETVGYRHGFHDRYHGWERRDHCSPRRAVEKARGYGLRDARIAYVTPRHVVVEGVRFHRHGRIAFANVRHCPVLWR